MSKDEFIDNVANEILQKVPNEYDVHRIERNFPTITPSAIVLFQELERFNKLIKIMRRTLINLCKVRHIGIIVMDLMWIHTGWDRRHTLTTPEWVETNKFFVPN